MKFILNVFFFFILIFNLTACTTGYHAKSHQDNKKVFYHLIDKLAFDITTQLKANSIMPMKSPIIILTPVSVDSFRNSNKLGKILQQNLISELFKEGFYVSDLNISKYVRVTKNGDFILTREWKYLSNELDINYLLISTMGKTKKGMHLNARIVYLENNQVLAAANTFIPKEKIKAFDKYANNVEVETGLLYRNYTFDK